MNKKIGNALLVILLFISLISIAYAAPARWGIAINAETQQCAGYWPGDEYTAYTLLPSWKAYFRDEKDMINTEYGHCKFMKNVGDAPGEEEKCCNTLGLTFVSSDAVKIDSVSYPFLSFLLFGSLILVMFLIIIGLIIYFIIRKIGIQRKKK